MFMVEYPFLNSVQNLVQALRTFANSCVKFYQELLIKERQRRVLTIEILKLYLEESTKLFANNKDI